MSDNCNCGCGHSHGHDHSHEDCECGGSHAATVVISLDGESDLTCNVIGTFDVEEREYIALQPTGEEEVLIFRYTESDGEVSLDNIESDEEYEAVAEVFYGLLEDEDEDFFDEDDEFYEDDDEDLDDEDDEN